MPHPIRSALFVLALFAIALIQPTPARAEVYKWVDAQGQAHYADRAPAGTNAQTVQVANEPAPTGPGVSSPANKAKAPKPLDIVMYATPTCGYCIRARNYFDQHALAWREINIDASPTAAADFRARGGQGTPLIFINGTRVEGFDTSKLDLILAQSGR
jgi:glutaredoxin